MESTLQKTFTIRWAFLGAAAVHFFILLIYPALSAASQFKIIRVTEGDTIKIMNNGKTSIIRLVGSDALETSKMKNGVVGPFCLNNTKNVPDLVSKKSVEKNCIGEDRYGRILRFFKWQEVREACQGC